VREEETKRTKITKFNPEKPLSKNSYKAKTLSISRYLKTD